MANCVKSRQTLYICTWNECCKIVNDLLLFYIVVRAMKIKFSSVCDKDDFELTIYTDPT